MERLGLLNIYAGWVYIVLGILSGVVLSWWSFDGPMKPPPGYENYASLRRRMTRLAHIAAFMLPVVCILYGQHIDDIPLSLGWKKTGSISMVVCMAGLPPLLFLGALKPPFKNLTGIPVTFGVIALSIMSFGNGILLVRYLSQ
jgi:hypothetical protein